METIADFISLGEGVSWCQSENGIEFYDTNLSQAMPELHHYQSWNLHEEQEYLREKWQYCQDNPTAIPAQSIKIYDSEGNLATRKVLNNLVFLPKLSSPSKHEDQTDDILNENYDKSSNVETQQYEEILDLPYLDIPNFVDVEKSSISTNMNGNVSISVTQERSQSVPQSSVRLNEKLKCSNTINSLESVNIQDENISNGTRHVSNFKPTITSTPQMIKPYKFQTKTGLLLAKLFGSIDMLAPQFDKEKAPYNNSSEKFKQHKKQILFETVRKLEVKILIISDELSENYRTWEKQWFINNNLQNPTNEDVKNDITAN